MLDARTGLFCGWRKKLILHPSNRLQRLDSVDGTSKAGWLDLWAWKPTNDHVVSTLDAIGRFFTKYRRYEFGESSRVSRIEFVISSHRIAGRISEFVGNRPLCV